MIVSHSLRISPSALTLPVIDLDNANNKACQYVYALIYQREFEKAGRTIRRLKDNAQLSHEAEYHYLMGKLLTAQGHYLEAETEYREALNIKPDYFMGWMALGEMLSMMGKHMESVDAFIEASKLRPADAQVYRMIGECCMAANALEQSVAYFTKSMEYDRDHWLIYHDLAAALHSQGRLQRAKECSFIFLEKMARIEHHTRVHADCIGAYVFQSMAREHDYEKLLDIFEKWAFTYCNGVIDVPLIRDTDKSRKIRVGYVGSDFYRHAASSIYRSLFEHANRDRFEIYAFSSTLKPDAFTEHLEKAFMQPDSEGNQGGHFFHVAGMSDDELFQFIRSKEIDILVDLNGHTVSNRLLVFSRKAAPIQLTGLGFVHPMNIPQFDYFFTDKHITTPDREMLTHDKPIHIPSIMQWGEYGNAREMNVTRPHETNGYITFGTTNNMYKISEQVIGVYAQILKKVKGSHLIIKNKQMSCEYTAAKVIEAFKKFGVDPEYILTFGQTDFRIHIDAWNDIDIGLDPFPYQGGVTSCEGLYMGTPIVSLNNGTRTTVSPLKSCGLDDLVVEDIPGYIDRAVSLAKQLKAGEYLGRQEIRDRFLSSPVCDIRSYVDAIEEAYGVVFNAFIDTQDEWLVENAGA